MKIALIAGKEPGMLGRRRGLWFTAGRLHFKPRGAPEKCLLDAMLLAALRLR